MAISSKDNFEPDFSITNSNFSSACKPCASQLPASYNNEDCESWGRQDIPKLLTDEEKVKLEKDKTLVTVFKQKKLELEAEKHWDLFYKRNTTKFFKDRHWTKREFIDLVIENKQGNGSINVFEVGCGVGNFMFPLMESDPSLKFIACDFSKRAIQFVKEHPQYDAERCKVFHCDATKDNLTSHILSNSIDLATMIFVLSAIHPDKMVDVLKNVFQVLKPGGHLLFRDYGLYDYAMLRFAPGHKLEENFYVRQDGTRAYYFSKGKLLYLIQGFKQFKNNMPHGLDYNLNPTATCTNTGMLSLYSTADLGFCTLLGLISRINKIDTDVLAHYDMLDQDLCCLQLS